MFSYVHHDRRKNKIHLWEKVGNRTVHNQFDHAIEYFVKSKVNSNLKTIYGDSVEKKVARHPSEIKKLKADGIETFETDFSEETKFLYKHYKDKLEPNVESFRVVSLDIEVAVERKFKWLREPIIENCLFPINLITMDFINEKYICTLGTQEYTGTSETVQKYITCANETDLLNRFISIWKKASPDIVIGWNVDGFDIKYIIQRMMVLGIDHNQLSSIGDVIEKKNTGMFKIPGTSIIDYLALYKKFMSNVKTLPSYSLQSVAMEEIGEGKLEYDGAINEFYKTDWNKFVEYNIQDTVLVEKIDAKLKFIRLMIMFCSEARVPFERVYSSISVIEGYMYQYLHEDGYVFPDFPYEVDQDAMEEIEKDPDEYDDDEESTGIIGGYVEAHPGFYYNCLSYDVESLYPTNIMTYNVSPENKVSGITKDEALNKNLILTPVDGVYYTRQVGILPKIIKRVFEERKYFKKLMKECENKGDHEGAAYYNLQQMTRKIFINSVYGVLGNKFFHFFDEDNANVVTAGGRDLIKFLAYNANEYFRDHFYKSAKKYFPQSTLKPNILSRMGVLIDTDSLFLQLNEIKKYLDPKADNIEFMMKMDKEVIAPFFNTLLDIQASKYDVENIVNFKREKVILKQYIQKKKNYITQIIADENVMYDKPKLKFTGIAIVRSDTPMHCRQTLKNMVEFMFSQDKLDINQLNNMIKKYYSDFKKQDPKNVSVNKNVNDYDKYAYPGEWYSKNGLVFKKRTPFHVKSAAIHNYMVNEFDLPLMEIGSGSKTKIVYLKPNNFLKVQSISFVGNWPTEFSKHFKIDHERQFQKYFIDNMQQMFTIIGLGNIDIAKRTLEVEED